MSKGMHDMGLNQLPLDQSSPEYAEKQRKINEQRLGILEDIRFSKENEDHASMAKFKQSVN